MQHSYHITIHMADGSTRTHVDLYPDSAAAASDVVQRIPTATRLDIKRTTTVLRVGTRAPGMPCMGRAAS